MKFKIFLIAIFTVFFALSANAQLRAYTFEYNDEFGGKQSCYLTLRGFDIAWDKTNANVLFDCNQSELMRERKIEPRKIFILTLKESDFVTSVSVPIASGDVGLPRAVFFSNMVWDLAETTDFIADYVWNEPQQKLLPVLKSLNDLNAERVDISLDVMRGKK